MNLVNLNDNVVIVSHIDFINSVYRRVIVGENYERYSLNKELFNIQKAYKKKKCYVLTEMASETVNILQRYEEIKQFLPLHLGTTFDQGTSNQLWCGSSKCTFEDRYYGGNDSKQSLLAEVSGEQYLIPYDCNFYNFDIQEISLHLTEPFDLIVLDPPWWNKYIRRKKAKGASDSYNMMWNEDFADLPMESLLKSTGLIAVWCTNSPTHIDALKNSIFPSWNMKFISEWFWLKVTQNGEVVTNFSPVNGKQPYERILFGKKIGGRRRNPNPPNNQLIISVPSIIHSHKPPLSELLKPFTVQRCKALEVFARNLLPGWTSYGNEVLKFQHLSLFERMYE